MEATLNELNDHLSQVPVELTHLIANEIAVIDWLQLRLTCKKLKTAIESLLDFHFAKLCLLSFCKNKIEEPHPHSQDATIVDGEPLFGNGLAAEVIQVRNSCLKNLIPRAFELVFFPSFVKLFALTQLSP